MSYLLSRFEIRSDRSEERDLAIIFVETRKAKEQLPLISAGGIDRDVQHRAAESMGTRRGIANKLKADEFKPAYSKLQYDNRDLKHEFENE